SGETVEIITSPQGHPHEDWLKIARSASARAKIRHWLRQERMADSVSLGKEMLERDLKRLRLAPGERELAEAAAGLGCTDLEQLYARLGEGTISSGSVLRRLQPPKESLADRLVKGPLEALAKVVPVRRPAAGVRIQG